MDVLGAAGLYANRVAKREITGARLTGNYGGEVLRSIIFLKPTKLKLDFCSPGLLEKVNEARQTLKSEQKVQRPLSFIAFKQVPWHHYARFSMENTQLVVRSPYLDNDLVKVAFRAPTSLEVNQRLAARLIKDGNPKLAAFPTDRGPLGRPGLFGKLDERWQEFTFKGEYAFDYGMPTSLVRFDNALKFLHLERLFLGRHKYYHFRYFYRTALAPYLKEVLLDRRTLKRSFFEPKVVEDMVTAHITGRDNFTLEIHALLTAELIQRELIESE
jgi:asparagine synthase (glutamine-hydrolysing)